MTNEDIENCKYCNQRFNLFFLEREVWDDNKAFDWFFFNKTIDNITMKIKTKIQYHF